MGELGRRRFLGAAGVAGGVLLTNAAPLATGRDVVAALSGPTRQDWRAFAASIEGDVVRRSDDRYDRVRLLFNTRFDGIRPAAVVRAANPSDVAEAIGFARRFALRCRVRAGGHSYVGASTVSDGLVLDLRMMRSVHYDSASGVAALGAGARSYRVHDLLARHGRTFPTGTCPTVGVAGLALGGGLGIDSTTQGLTCDALTGLTMVTADGRVRQVDAARDAGLWWACRGGGGGNFGVVTGLRFRTHTARPMGLFSLTYPWRDAAAAVRGWAARIQAAPRSVWCNLRLSVGADGITSVKLGGRCVAGDQDEQAAALERAVGVDAAAVTTSEKSFMEGVEHFGGGSTNPRGASIAGSDVVTGMSEVLAEALPRIMERRAGSGTLSMVILDPLTGAVRDQQPASTAFPWRLHLAELQWLVQLPANHSDEAVRASRAWVNEAHQSIASRSVGAYVNRLEPGRPLADYYAANLPRLRRVKGRVDPDNFFRSPYAIGS